MHALLFLVVASLARVAIGATFGDNIIPQDSGFTSNLEVGTAPATGSPKGWSWQFSTACTGETFGSTGTTKNPPPAGDPSVNANDLTASQTGTGPNAGACSCTITSPTFTMSQANTYYAYLSNPGAAKTTVTIHDDSVGFGDYTLTQGYFKPAGAGPFYITIVFSPLTASKSGEQLLSIQQVTGYGGMAPTYYRRAMKLQQRYEAEQKAINFPLCPAGLTGCPLSRAIGSAGSYECIDTLTELNSCGGCVFDRNATGVDCEKMVGVKEGAVTCLNGRCVAMACDTRRGYSLRKGVCVI